MSRLVLSSELSREALEEIVSRLQGLLYLDLGHDGREFWNPGKDWSGWDVCQAIQETLQRHVRGAATPVAAPAVEWRAACLAVGALCALAWHRYA